MKTTHKNPESGDGPIGESYLPQRTEVMKERERKREGTGEVQKKRRAKR